MEKISQGREEISHHKNELVSRLKGISRENQQLMYMIEVMSRNYNGLQAQLKKQQEVELRLSSKSMPETLKLDLNTPGGDFNSEGCGKHAIDYSVDSGSTISEISVEKNSKSFFIENDLLPAKKRRIKNELEQGAKGKEDSYTDGNLPDKKTNEQNNVLVMKGTRSEATTISDGCQWRKYGQKMTRNSLWPRAYYKCAIPSCPVRKKVQKCAQNPNILNTTYEGEHNHMLSPVTMPFPASIATISSIGSSPTITLDLTQNHNPNPNLIPTSGLQPPHPQTTSGSFLQPWVWLYE